MLKLTIQIICNYIEYSQVFPINDKSSIFLHFVLLHEYNTPLTLLPFSYIFYFGRDILLTFFNRSRVDCDILLYFFQLVAIVLYLGMFYQLLKIFSFVPFYRINAVVQKTLKENTVFLRLHPFGIRPIIIKLYICIKRRKR